MTDISLHRFPVNIEDEMKRSYMDYAMSVIIGRALPDVRDGLKPAHRRVLYAMRAMGLSSGRPYRKCAKIVGEVIGNFHPHGDAPAYDTLVRLAQDFNMRYLLVDGQGNFGSVDGDPPAAYRYTEARLEKLAEEMMGGSRQGNCRLRPQLRRDDRRTDGPADDVPEPARQRIDRHRRRDGDEHPAAQHGRGHRRRHRAHRKSRAVEGEPSQVGSQGGPRSGLSDRRVHRRPSRHLLGLHHRTRLDHRPRKGHDRGIEEGRQGLDRHHRDSRIRSTRSDCSRTSPISSARRRSRGFPICATSPTATACGSSSS